MATDKPSLFADFDAADVFRHSLKQAEDEATANFVVEFGRDKARIAFDWDTDELAALLAEKRVHELPVRWINIWAPDKQPELVRELGTRYRFSPRLLAIITSKPILKPWTNVVKHKESFVLKMTKTFQRRDLQDLGTDIELGRRGKRVNFEGRFETMSHYAIANQMINYQSVDVGDRYLCIGANWMHYVPPQHEQEDVGAHLAESQRRLWSWLVLCDDQTVISIHEDTGPILNLEIIRSVRGNTLSVLRQLSQSYQIDDRSDPISLQSVRAFLDIYPDTGRQGASILYYYLFDDWTAAYNLLAAFHRRLEELSAMILGDVHRQLGETTSIDIIPSLHVLGREMRGVQHLYENYSNIIERILRASGPSGQTSVTLTPPARQRFDRLGDRIRLLVLSELHEYLVEKDALVSTYFNLTAQRDSEATARLTRSATLLAKLSVLFLPVGLMTSYFSVQIDDLAGVYTAKTYWVAFGVIMSISFVGIFFFSRLLMFVSDTIDDHVKSFARYIRRSTGRRRTKDS